MVSVTKNNTPALRFDGFGSEWEAKPLKNLGSSYGGLTGKTKEDFGHGDARYITYLNVFEHAVIRDASQLGNTEIDNRQNEVKTGDVLFTVSSEVPEEVGMSAVWLGQGQSIYLNSFCFGFRPTTKLDSKFLAYVLRSPDFREKMTLLAQGISRFNISKTRAMELEISLPTLEEQCAIGKLFAELDALIEQHRAKHANLQQAKTALMQRMFPQDGANEPELRLGGFSGAWEPKKVDEICPLQRGFDLPASKMVEGSVPVVTSNGVVRHHNKALVKGPGVTTGRSGSIGKVHFVEQDYWPHNTSLWVTDFKGNDPRFVYYLLQRIDPSRFSSGSGVPTLNRNDLHDFVSHIPPILEEQRAIGEVFADLDALIAAEQRYIAQLTQAKTALLQRMFV